MNVIYLRTEINCLSYLPVVPVGRHDRQVRQAGAADRAERVNWDNQKQNNSKIQIRNQY